MLEGAGGLTYLVQPGSQVLEAPVQLVTGVVEILVVRAGDWLDARGWAWAWLPGSPTAALGWMTLARSTTPRAVDINIRDWVCAVDGRLPGCAGGVFDFGELHAALLAPGAAPHPPPPCGCV